MIYIYILKCENDKYFIDETHNINFKLTKDFQKNKYKWTDKYKPLEILQIISNCNENDLDKYVKQYMSIYGIANVRGGSYLDIKLDNNLVKSIQLEITTNINKNICYKCNNEGHLASECIDINTSMIELSVKEYSVIHRILEKITTIKKLDPNLLKSYVDIFKSYIRQHALSIESVKKKLEELLENSQKNDDLKIQLNINDSSKHLDGFKKTITNLNEIANKISIDYNLLDLLEINTQLINLFKYLKFIYQNDTYLHNFDLYFT
jgi:hypothetical protein